MWNKLIALCFVVMISVAATNAQVFDLTYQVNVDYPAGSKYIEKIVQSDISNGLTDKPSFQSITNDFVNGVNMQYPFNIALSFQDYLPKRLLVSGYEPQVLNAEAIVKTSKPYSLSFEFDGRELKRESVRFYMKHKKMMSKTTLSFEEGPKDIDDFVFYNFLHAYHIYYLTCMNESYKDIPSMTSENGPSYSVSKTDKSIIIKTVEVGVDVNYTSVYTFSIDGNGLILQSLVCNKADNYTLDINLIKEKKTHDLDENNISTWRN